MKILVYVLTILVYAGLVALVIWALAVRSRMPVKDKIAGLLQLVATYTFILGLLSSSGVFKVFDKLQLNLTSPNPLVFLSANTLLFSILFGGMVVALDPSTNSSELRFLLGLPILFAEALLLFAYAVIHFLVIVPIAYFGYLATSVPIDAILNSGSDIEFAMDGNVMRIKELISQNEAAVRNFAVSLPAFATSLVLKIWPLLRRGEKRPT